MKIPGKLKGKALIGSGIVIIIFVISISILRMVNNSASEKWLKNPQMPGKKISVDSHSLYVTVKGSGSPAVIIETGLGSSSPEWWHIQDQLANYTTVVTYDRAGYGWSDSGPFPRTSMQVINELRTILKKTTINGPYILVGHSIGGLYAQHFARLRPGKVKGLVLVAPFTDDYRAMKKKVHRAIYNNFINEKTRFGFARFLAYNGLLRAFNARPYKHAPAKIQPLITEQYSLAKSYQAIFNEYGTGLKKSIRWQKAKKISTGLPPLVIINPSVMDSRKALMRYELPYEEIRKIEQVKKEITKKLLKHSRRGRVIYTKKAIKEIHFQEPGLIINAVLDFIKK